MPDWMTFFNKHLDRYALIDKEVFPIVQSKTGESFYIDRNLCTYKESLKQYCLNGIRRTDTVIDIGANIGSFSLIASKKCAKVHAFEPVLYDELVRNIELNQPNWITPHKEALGYEMDNYARWDGKTVLVSPLTLTKIKELCGRCDFLKCDCEGAEWGIKPEELADIRRIEIEFHHWANWHPHLIDGIHNLFNCTTKYDKKTDTYWISGVNKDERL